MEYRIFKPGEMPSDLWVAYHQIRDADPLKDNPQFDPHLARLMGEVRPDTRIVVASQADEPVAFWPMHIRPGRWARPLGGPFSDWHGPIISPDAHIKETDILTGAGVYGMTVHAYLGQKMFDIPEGLAVHASQIADVSMGFDKYIENQSKLFPKHFKKMRRITRNTVKDFSSVEFNYDDPDPATLAWLIMNKREQYKRTNRHDVLGSDWVQKYIDVLRHMPGDRFASKVMSMRIDGRLAAVEVNLASDRVMHGWMISYEMDFSRYSPGYQLWQEALRMMLDKGITQYDAGPSMEYYKKYFANYTIPQASGVLRTQHSKFSPTRFAASGWRATEHVMPRQIGHIMGRARRRGDQIAASEIQLGARVKSLLGAMKPSGD